MRVDLVHEPTPERLGRRLLAQVDVFHEVEAIIGGTARDPVKDALNARPMEARALDYARTYERDERASVNSGAGARRASTARAILN